MSLAKDKYIYWHPWPQQQLELLRGNALSNPCCRQFAQSYVIGTVQSGAGLLQYRNSQQEIGCGALYVLEPDEIWSCQSQEMTFTHIMINPALMQHLATEIIGTENPLPHFTGPGLHDSALSLNIETLCLRLTTSASRLEQQELLQEVLEQMLLSHTTEHLDTQRQEWDHRAIEHVKAYLAEHYAEDVSLETLASIAHLSEFHLTRVFHRAVGLPPHAYLLQVRLSHARTLLAQGLPAGYVAHETGFFDQTHFTHQFKRHIGVTPGTYRKTARFY